MEDLPSTRAEAFTQLGISTADCARLVGAVTENPESQALIRALKEKLQAAGNGFAADAFERALLRAAATETAPRIANLPVPEPVKKLLREEFEFYCRPSRASPLEVGRSPFVIACKMISLRRFPAGPLDWEMGGFPRSWLLKVRKSDLARVVWFLTARVGGFRPMFFTHTARQPKNRSLIIQKEVFRAYFRIASALELQPEVKGILTASWFHDDAAVKDNPLLDALNQPYREEGGLIASMGPAPADSGFLEHNAARRKAFESGELQYKIAVAIWPRRAAIAWARKHRELLER
jgi:hypothetical protein